MVGMRLGEICGVLKGGFLSDQVGQVNSLFRYEYISVIINVR